MTSLSVVRHVTASKPGRPAAPSLSANHHKMSFFTRLTSRTPPRPPLPTALADALATTPTAPIIEQIWTTLVSLLPISVTEFLGMVDFEHAQRETLPWSAADNVEFHVMDRARARRASVSPRLPVRETLVVAGVRTETLAWEPPRVTNLVLMVPGNPGLADFYVGLLEHIHYESGQTVACVGVSYAAHSALLRNPVPSTFRHTLEEQVQHTIDVFDVLAKERYPKARFWIVGHSIGSYVALRLLSARSEAQFRIAGVFGLFPTLEAMKTTPNGTRLSPLFKPLFRNAAASLIGGMASMLPTDAFIDATAKISKTPRDVAQVVALQLLHREPLLSVLTMADCEMREVAMFDESLVRGKLDRIVLYYGTNDDWAPAYLAKGMQERFPDGRVLIDEHKLPHAFMLHPHGPDVLGHYVLKWMDEITRAKSLRRVRAVVSEQSEREPERETERESERDPERESERDPERKPERKSERKSEKSRTAKSHSLKESRSVKEWVVEAKKSNGINS